MAFGGLRSTFTGNGNSIGASNALTGSVAVSVADLVFAVLGQQTNLTAGTASDNLGNAYTAQNAGTDAGVVTGRAYYSVITASGTLTTISITASSSTNDWCGLGAAIEGPFTAIDVNVANITTDVTSPFTCPSSGTLAQAEEAVVTWGAANQSTVWAATSPNLLAGNSNNSTNVKVAIGYQATTTTSALTPEFTAAANPSAAVLGTCSFKRDTTKEPGTMLIGGLRNSLMWQGSAGQ
jgi:hypothetical protein